jgi:protein-arginine kinase activator protein McsA
MDYHELAKMKVVDLRELAIAKTKLTGVSGIHKEELIDKLAGELGIEKPHKVAKIEGKAEIKKRLHLLKAKRLEALEKRDSESLAEVRKELKKIRRRLQHAAKAALHHS